MRLTDAQNKARKLLACEAMFIMLAGGSRSGKSVSIIRRMAANGLRVPCRQVILRRNLNTVKSSIGMDTLPKVIQMLKKQNFIHLNKSDWIFTVHGCEGEGSEIWLLGLDDKERADKVLGMEFATMFFNECSEISWDSFETAKSRLAQNVPGLRNRAYFDCNPPSKTHWTHRAFVEKIHPVTRVPWPDPENWQWLRMNPQDNLANLPQDYIKSLETLAPKKRQRFLAGEWTDDAENALWKRHMIDPYRVNVMPTDLEMVVVAIDPSGGDGPGNCDAGIIVAGKKRIGADDHFYVLADGTTTGAPSAWGSVAVNLYHQYKASLIVAEVNYGGAMVESVIKSIEGGRQAGYRAVTASRSKIVRAEPIATQYGRGLVHHVGDLLLLEDEMCSYAGPADDSPNRMDALVWAVTALMEGGSGTIVQVSNHFGF